MSPGSATEVAVTFVWLGMVLAISFLEAPLKFRAPNVTLPIGLGIGRLVFRVLNRIEIVFAIVIVVATMVSPPGIGVMVAYVIAFAALASQLAVIRPRLNRRSDKVLAGHEGPRSHVHYVYVGVEAVKVIALLVAGIFLLSG